MANYISSQLGNWHDDMFNLIYPIGSIYISMSPIHPNGLFGGTWEEIKNVFLISQGSVYTNNSTGGKARYSASDMPAHTHTRGTMEIEGTWWTGWNKDVRGFHNTSCTGAFYKKTDTSRPGRIRGEDSNASNSSINGMPWFKASEGWTGATSQSGTVSQPLIVPPYLAVYMWKRIA